MKFRIHLLSLLFFFSLPIISPAQNWGGRGGGGGGNQAMRSLQQANRNAQAFLTGTVYLIEEDGEQTPGAGVTVIVITPGSEEEKADTTSIEGVISEVTTLLTKDLARIESDLSAVRNDMGKYNMYCCGDMCFM